MKSLLHLAITIVILFCFQLTSTATIYHTSGSGHWDAAGLPNPINETDTVYIDNMDNISLLTNLNVKGYLFISPSATLSGPRKISIAPSGRFYNEGTINTTEDLLIDGYFYNSGNAYIKKLHNDGYICNSRLIQLTPGEEFDFHGGEVACCGTILADKIKVHKNTDVNFNGNPAATTDCQNICNNSNSGSPSFEGNVTEQMFLDNIDPSNSQINTTNVGICNPAIAALPISLATFTAKYIENGKVLISWVTNSEQNNDYFNVLRSVDGILWEKIAQIEGAGNSDQILTYEVVDQPLTTGLVYYRLQQTDFNGDSKSFKIVTVNVTTLITEYSIYPNPAFSNVNLYSKTDIQPKDIQIINTLGMNVSSNVYIRSTTDTQFIIDISNLSQGFYFIKINEEIIRLIKE